MDARLRPAVIPFAASLLCIAVLVPLLGARSVWFDEAISAGFSVLPLPQLWTAIQHVDATFGLYYALLHGVRVFGGSDVALRSLSALATVGTVIGGYLLAREAFAERAAAVAAMLLAVTPFLLNEGDDARPYALVACLTTWSGYAFLRACAEPTRARFVRYAVLAACATYVHPFAALAILAQAVSLAVVRPPRATLRAWAVTYACVAVAALPVVWELHVAQRATQLAWLARPHLRDLWYLVAGIDGNSAGETVLVLLAVAGGLRAAWSDERRTAVTVAVWFALPVAIAFVVSRVAQPMFLLRYLIDTIVPLIVLAALGIARLPSRALAVGATALLVVWSTRIDLHNLRTPGENFRGAAAYVDRVSGPNDAIVAFPPAVRYALDQEKPRHDRETIAYPGSDWHFWTDSYYAPAPPPPSTFAPYHELHVVLRTDSPVPSYDAWRRRALARYHVVGVHHFTSVDVIDLTRG